MLLSVNNWFKNYSVVIIKSIMLFGDIMWLMKDYVCIHNYGCYVVLDYYQCRIKIELLIIVMIVGW